MLTLILEAVLSLGDFNFHTETCGFPISVFSLSFSQQAHKAYERPMDSMGCLLNYSRCSFIIPFMSVYVASYQRHDLRGSLLCVQCR